MLLGNDPAGGHMDMYSVTCEKPVIDKSCKLAVDDTECVVTRAKAIRKLRGSRKIM